MTTFQRVDSVAVLGVEVSANMDIFTLLEAMNIGLDKTPGLKEVFQVYMTPLEALAAINLQIVEKLQVIVDLKDQLKAGKRALELASKSFTVGATLSVGNMDVKIMYNGTALMTGASGILTPLKATLEAATQALQSIEDEITSKQLDLMTIIQDYRKELDIAVQNLMQKIAELSNINITIVI